MGKVIAEQISDATSASVDPELLPDLSSDYPLSQGQIEAFARDGHILLRRVCTPEEVAAYRLVIREASRRMNTETRAAADRDTFGKAFLQTQQLRLSSPGVRKFVLARRFGKIAAQLMGVRGVRIFHEQSLFKEPGGAVTPWHQDQYYWPFAEPTMLGMWMPLVDVTPEMGGMKFASGTHKLGNLGSASISDQSQEQYEQLIAERQIPVVMNPMQAGDATFHTGWTLHAAGANLSSTLREAMIVTMFADGMRVAVPQNKEQEADRIKVLGGTAPGELADGSLNTLIYAE